MDKFWPRYFWFVRFKPPESIVSRHGAAAKRCGISGYTKSADAALECVEGCTSEKTIELGIQKQWGDGQAPPLLHWTRQSV
jgi:hypothetical protein